MRLIKLTQGGGFYDGKPCYINVDHITLIREEGSIKDSDGNRTDSRSFNTSIGVVSRGDVMHVKEEVSQVMEMLGRLRHMANGEYSCLQNAKHNPEHKELPF